jgi:hypothetical protein
MLDDNSVEVDPSCGPGKQERSDSHKCFRDAQGAHGGERALYYPEKAFLERGHYRLLQRRIFIGKLLKLARLARGVAGTLLPPAVEWLLRDLDLPDQIRSWMA